jgi:hypothetical protein
MCRGDRLDPVAADDDRRVGERDRASAVDQARVL